MVNENYLKPLFHKFLLKCCICGSTSIVFLAKISFLAFFWTEKGYGHIDVFMMFPW